MGIKIVRKSEEIPGHPLLTHHTLQWLGIPRKIPKIDVGLNRDHPVKKDREYNADLYTPDNIWVERRHVCGQSQEKHADHGDIYSHLMQDTKSLMD